MGGLLHLVQRGGAWAGCVPAQSPPRCTKCNRPPINGQCTNFILFDVALSLHLNSKRLTSKVKRRHQTKSIRGRHLGRSEIKLVQSEIIGAVSGNGIIKINLLLHAFPVVTAKERNVISIAFRHRSVHDGHNCRGTTGQWFWRHVVLTLLNIIIIIIYLMIIVYYLFIYHLFIICLLFI